VSQPDTELETGEVDLDSITAAMGEEGGEIEVEDEELPEGEEEEVLEDGQDGQDPPQADEDPEFEVEVAGEKSRVKLSELRAGYMKDADYRRKTAEVAEQRRQVEQVAQHIVQKQQAAANQLDVFLGALHKELIGSQPDASLIDSDPQEFMRQQAAYNTRAQQFQQALQQRQAIQAQQEQEQQRRMTEVVQAEQQRLLDAAPELRDEKQRVAALNGVAQLLTSIGYTQEELSQLVDHRALLVALKAAKFDQLQAAKAKQAPPEVRRTVRPGAAAAGAQPNAQKLKFREQLKRDPNNLDAIAGLMD